MKELERRARAGPLNVELRDGKVQLSGYAAVFNSLSEDLGGFRERIAPGAFRKTLAAGADVRALFNHDPNQILGRTKNGTLRLSEDDHGLKMEIQLPETRTANDLIEVIRRGDVDGASFGFSARRDLWTTENGTYLRTLHEVELHDVSVVVYPAYPDTSVALRALDIWRRSSQGGLDTDAALLKLKRFWLRLLDAE